MKIETKTIHAGVSPDPVSGAIMTPIYQTSTYVQEAPGKHKGYEYARTQNPTRDALQNNLAALENARFGVAFSSGLAAVDAIIKLLSPGDEVIASNDLYGGTYRLFRKIFEKYGIRFHFTEMAETEDIRKLINKNTRLIWIETPTNPMLNIIDIKAVCGLAREQGIQTVVDNTFASPYLQNPMDLGADMVMHSATKYLGGHSDVVLGAVLCSDEALAEALYFIQNSSGAVPGPQDCFLVLRGIKTLHVRMDRHCENGRAIAAFLKNHEKVEKVYWPGFSDHPKHQVAAAQMRDFGGMISFTLKGNRFEDAHKVLSNTKLFALAESLGGVESLIGHPASMTHAAIPKEEREKSGVVDSLIRLSVGIEHKDDLIADLGMALGKL